MLLALGTGAISTRQMPQDLLMNTAGDPGRRCYPLALLTASALAQGGAEAAQPKALPMAEEDDVTE